MLAHEDKHVVLCLDEAQAMPIETLEALRLLTNLETEKRKLLQIVMFGQPELDHKLHQGAIRQLNQRITFHYDLGPLSKDDLEIYLSHRLGVAGYAGSRLFERGAVKALYGATRGVPRLVNILAHKALMLAYGQGKQKVTARHVQVAAKDTGAARTRAFSWVWSAAAAVAMLGTGVGMMGWAYFR